MELLAPEEVMDASPSMFSQDFYEGLLQQGRLAKTWP
jgi:hypothetical protein